jgi:hypothetical protein
MRQPKPPFLRQNLQISFVRSARPWLAVVMIVALLAPITVHAAQQHLFRYRNAQDKVEISHTIPTDRVALGYEVIDSRSGRVLEVVEPQKTQAEVDRIKRETQARNACAEALARVQAMYQSEGDIDAAEQQTIRSLDGRIENATLNLRQVRDQKRDFEATAAHLERAGKPLDSYLVTNIERARVQEGNLQQEIEQRHREQDDARARFARDLAIFRQGTCEDEAALGFIQTDVANIAGAGSKAGSTTDR